MAGGRDSASGGKGGSDRKKVVIVQGEVSCGKCDGIIDDKKESSVECDLCGDWVHSKCMNLGKTQVTMLTDIPCMWFVCDECRDRANEVLFRDILDGSNNMVSKIDNLSSGMKKLKKDNEDNMRAIKDEMMDNMKVLNEGTVSILKAEIEKLSGNTSTGKSESPLEKVEKQLRDINMNEKNKGSYAQKLVTGLEKNQLIIKCVDDEKKATDHRSAIAKSLLAIKVNKIIPGKDGDVIVTLSSKELVDKAKEALDVSELKDELVTWSKDKIQPKIRICDVEKDQDTDLTFEQLRVTLLEKNSYLKDLIRKADDFKVVKRMNSKRNDAYHFVIRCTPEIRKIIRTQHEDFLYSLMSRHKVTDHIHVWQCYRCQDFQHSAVKCPENPSNETCAKCSGNHRTSGCESTDKKCINCTKANRQNTNHYAYSMDCPSYKSKYNGILVNTDYGL